MTRESAAWGVIAASAAAAVEQAKQGGKEQALHVVAKELGLAGQTLRTYLLARRFAESLPLTLRSLAYAIPVAAVEILARWDSYDHHAAIRALEEYDQLKLSVRALRYREAVARSSFEPTSGRRREFHYRDDALDRIWRFETVWPPERPSYEIQEAQATAIEDASGKADFVLQFGSHKSDLLIAGLIVGPYASTYQYSGRAADWCLRALGLTFFFPFVALVLPPNAPAAGFARFLDATPKAADHIQVVRDPVVS